MDKEIIEFNAKFDTEIKEIMIITETNPIGGAKGGNEKLYEVKAGITAWKNINSNEIFTGEYYLTCKADLDKVRELQNKVLPDTIYTLKIRQNKNAFLLVEIIENNIKDDELERILKEQIKPVIYTDETLGKFILDKRFNIYTGKIKWNNKNIEMEIEKYTGKRLTDVFIIANDLVKDQILWDKKVKEFAAEKLLKVKNKEWLEEDEKEMVKEQFIKKIKLERISVFIKNKFEFCFDDNEIFWGHSIIVYGNLEKGLIKAEVEG